MIDKKLTALLGSALLVAAALPLALAHQTGPSTTSDDLTPLVPGDTWRHGAGGTSGVSGNYFGSVGAYIKSPGLFPNQTDNAVSFAFALCDLEVLGDGSGHDALDEDTVDGDDDNGATHNTTTLGGLGAGKVRDGTFDDGGVGGACHTNEQYSHDEYNTDGCIGTVHAEDAVSGGHVWIGAACDDATHGSGPGLSTCVANEIISEPTPGGLAQCVADFLEGGATGGFVTCGDDGSADNVAYGTGSGGVTFPPYGTYTNGTGVTHVCAEDDAASAVFVFNYVDETRVGAVPDPDDPFAGAAIVPATAGWIDTA